MRRIEGRLPLGAGAFEGVRLEIEGVHIVAVERLPMADPGLPIVSSGWIDLQCNGALGHDFSDPEADFDEVPSFLARNGVTGYLATVITAAPESYPAVLARLRDLSAIPGSRFLGIHLEGPFLSPGHRGAHNPGWLMHPDRAKVELLAVEPVRMVTLAPELDGALEAISRLREMGVVPSAGHSGATYEEARDAFAAGLGAGTHLFNAMPPLHHREPGLAGALLESASPPSGLIADGIHLHPAMVRLAWRARGPDGLFPVTDAVPAVGLPPGEYSLSGQRIWVDVETARMEDGRLAGSLLTMDRAIANLAAWTGDLAGVLRAASETPARILGLSKRRGRLVPGLDADLVLFDDGLNVLETIVGGRTVHRR